MNVIRWLLLATLCLGGRRSVGSTPPQKCDEGTTFAVLRKLQPILGEQYNATRSVIEGDPSDAAMREQQEKVTKIRKWAVAMPHGCIRDEYLSWIDAYYQVGLDEAREEKQTHAARKNQDDYERETNKEMRKAAKQESSIPTPPQP